MEPSTFSAIFFGRLRWAFCSQVLDEETGLVSYPNNSLLIEVQVQHQLTLRLKILLSDSSAPFPPVNERGGGP